MLSRPSSADFAPDERHIYCLNETADHLRSISVRHLGPAASYEVDYETRRLPGIQVLVARGTPVEVSRSQIQIDKNPSRHYLIATNMDGGWSVIQAESELHLAPGETALWRSDLPYTVRIHASYRRTFALIDMEELRARIPHVESLVVRQLRASRWVSVLLQRLGPLARREEAQLDDPERARGFASAVISMLATGITALDDEAASAIGAPGRHHLDRAKAFIHRELADPTLCVAKVAAALNLSATHLQRLFRREGITVARYLWQQRLERSAAGLRDPIQGGQAISTLAYSHGFTSVAHFSRAFRTQFGESPTAYRARHGQADRRAPRGT